ncbi:MAG TPA: zinc ribbon domain-containing protein [Pseudolysinimonas sp.]|nr:zinc ribbon domain-containing protein [Pseudolysinimonas sp.]
MARPRGSFPCPVCGERVPAGAKVCRECGSDETTGWSEDTLYDDLDLPDPGYGAEESAPRSGRAARGIRSREVGAVLVLLFVLLLLKRIFG